MITPEQFYDEVNSKLLRRSYMGEESVKVDPRSVRVLGELVFRERPAEIEKLGRNDRRFIKIADDLVLLGFVSMQPLDETMELRKLHPIAKMSSDPAYSAGTLVLAPYFPALEAAAQATDLSEQLNNFALNLSEGLTR